MDVAELASSFQTEKSLAWLPRQPAEPSDLQKRCKVEDVGRDTQRFLSGAAVVEATDRG